MKLKDLFLTEVEQSSSLQQALSKYLAVNTEKGCFVISDIPSSTSPEQFAELVSAIPISNLVKKQILGDRVKDINSAIQYWTEAAKRKYNQDASNHLGEYFKSVNWKQFIQDRQQFDSQ